MTIAKSTAMKTEYIGLRIPRCSSTTKVAMPHDTGIVPIESRMSSG